MRLEELKNPQVRAEIEERIRQMRENYKRKKDNNEPVLESKGARSQL